jgi:putative transposase
MELHSFCDILTAIVVSQRLEIIYFQRCRKIYLALARGNMPASRAYYRRRLPHIHPEAMPLFITFNLADSLPRAVLAELIDQRERELRSAANDPERQYKIQKKYFGRYDQWLDQGAYGQRWLEKENIARIIADEIHKLDRERYALSAFCIMPNHVHILFEHWIQAHQPAGGRTAPYPVAETMRLLKGRTARSCNLVLGRNGKFWHHESYDHYVRDDGEFSRIIAYIINNPVKAGLIKEWEEWKFSYVNPELGEWQAAAIAT